MFEGSAIVKIRLYRAKLHFVGFVCFHVEASLHSVWSFCSLQHLSYVRITIITVETWDFSQFGILWPCRFVGRCLSASWPWPIRNLESSHFLFILYLCRMASNSQLRALGYLCYFIYALLLNTLITRSFDAESCQVLCHKQPSRQTFHQAGVR